jgi:hypothetical protein
VVEVFILTKEDFDDILEKFPAFKKRVHTFAAQRLLRQGAATTHCASLRGALAAVQDLADAIVNGFETGDSVIVNRKGALFGRQGMVTDPSLNGRVKIVMDGVTKSYLPHELAKATAASKDSPRGRRRSLKPHSTLIKQSSKRDSITNAIFGGRRRSSLTKPGTLSRHGSKRDSIANALKIYRHSQDFTGLRDMLSRKKSIEQPRAGLPMAVSDPSAQYDRKESLDGYNFSHIYRPQRQQPMEEEGQHLVVEEEEEEGEEGQHLVEEGQPVERQCKVDGEGSGEQGMNGVKAHQYGGRGAVDSDAEEGIMTRGEEGAMTQAEELIASPKAGGVVVVAAGGAAGAAAGAASTASNATLAESTAHSVSQVAAHIAGAQAAGARIQDLEERVQGVEEQVKGVERAMLRRMDLLEQRMVLAMKSQLDGQLTAFKQLLLQHSPLAAAAPPGATAQLPRLNAVRNGTLPRQDRQS